ncbi:FAD-dependent monooxygenase [Amycolatopsis sp. PS_44_ISF1]|uniref:FAD-dependent monooxygenase n=1 Tax=Amycolatopsis sp. PS_44_ISF1 TaxID=2974917 RepID=UPI0028DFFC27|nr:FAD-dependent monooxygenase [Amycolatopsis sp. PS_44_ISF1]MDT8915306.1 FAD-dependent monooxygenase [Amycolatopsis sp. PS_44_ISF1]
MTKNVRRVLVSGGGISGLAVAGALARRGVEVDVAEVRADPAVTGIEISVPNNALRMLKALGVLDETVAAGYVFDEYVRCDAAGAPVVALPCPSFSDGVPGYLGIARARLAGILRTAVVSAGARLRTGVGIEEFTDGPPAAQVRLSDGREGEYDLVVGCEGLRSPLRTRLFGAPAGPVFTGYSCWRAKPGMPRRVDAMTKFAGATTDAGLVPITEDEMYLFHLTAEPGNPRHEPAARRDLLEERLAGYTGLVAEVRENLPPAEEIVYSPLFEVRLPAPWHTGRAIVIGDAAHALVPHLSQGGAQALEDAVVLAEELTRRPPAEALPAFMKRRFDRARHLQHLSSAMLVREMTGYRAGRAEPGTELSREMASIRAYLDQAV